MGPAGNTRSKKAADSEKDPDFDQVKKGLTHFLQKILAEAREQVAKQKPFKSGGRAQAAEPTKENPASAGPVKQSPAPAAAAAGLQAPDEPGPPVVIRDFADFTAKPGKPAVPVVTRDFAYPTAGPDSSQKKKAAPHPPPSSKDNAPVEWEYDSDELLRGRRPKKAKPVKPEPPSDDLVIEAKFVFGIKPAEEVLLKASNKAGKEKWKDIHVKLGSRDALKDVLVAMCPNVKRLYVLICLSIRPDLWNTAEEISDYVVGCLKYLMPLLPLRYEFGFEIAIPGKNHTGADKSKWESLVRDLFLSLCVAEGYEPYIEADKEEIWGLDSDFEVVKLRQPGGG
jgi:hypothetical protein